MIKKYTDGDLFEQDYRYLHHHKCIIFAHDYPSDWWIDYERTELTDVQDLILPSEAEK